MNAFDETARRFGLRAHVVDGDTILERHGAGVRFSGIFDAADRRELVAACLGARFGLDAQASDGRHSPDENVARLLPIGAIDVVERITGTRPRTQTWLHAMPLAIASVASAGKHTWLADDDPDCGRRGAFYEAYKLRPAERRTIEGGSLAIFRRPAASAIGSLFPDFDVDAARDGGALLVLGFDLVAVYRPSADPHWAALRAAARQLNREARFPLTHRIVHLATDRLIVGGLFDVSADPAPSDIGSRFVELSMTTEAAE